MMPSELDISARKESRVDWWFFSFILPYLILSEGMEKGILGRRKKKVKGRNEKIR